MSASGERTTRQSPADERRSAIHLAATCTVIWLQRSRAAGHAEHGAASSRLDQDADQRRGSGIELAGIGVLFARWPDQRVEHRLEDADLAVEARVDPGLGR